MDDFIKDFMDELFDMEMISKYDFRETCGFTFVFRSEFIHIRENITSASIAPVAIIYEEKGEYFLAPLDEAIDKNEIIKEYVEKHIQK